jgi:hypothetical protein
MKLDAGTTEQFRADARMHRSAEKLRAECTTRIGHRPAPSEVASCTISSGLPASSRRFPRHPHRQRRVMRRIAVGRLWSVEGPTAPN